MIRPRVRYMGVASFMCSTLLMSNSDRLDGQTQREIEQQIQQYVIGNRSAAISLLERAVNINSGTLNPDGVREVGAVFSTELSVLGFEVNWIEMPPEIERGEHLFAYRRGRGKRFLLIGHLDTVFEKDSPFQKAWRRSLVLGRLEQVSTRNTTECSSTHYL